MIRRFAAATAAAAVLLAAPAAHAALLSQFDFTPELPLAGYDTAVVDPASLASQLKVRGNVLFSGPVTPGTPVVLSLTSGALFDEIAALFTNGVEEPFNGLFEGRYTFDVALNGDPVQTASLSVSIQVALPELPDLLGYVIDEFRVTSTVTCFDIDNRIGQDTCGAPLNAPLVQMATAQRLQFFGHLASSTVPEPGSAALAAAALGALVVLRRRRPRRRAAGLAGALLLAAAGSQAALHDRGGGLIYDDVLDLTWLQDANYAKTSGYSPTGAMTWDQARAWADQLVYAGFTGWQLPTITPSNGSSFQYGGSTDGSTDAGYNITHTTSPLAYMHAVNLGNASGLTVAGFQGPCGNTTSCQVNTGPFINFGPSYASWYGQSFDALGPGFAWVYATQSGYQTGINQTQNALAWAVHPGDIAAAVPEPSAALLLAGGLAGLAALARMRQSSR